MAGDVPMGGSDSAAREGTDAWRAPPPSGRLCCAVRLRAASPLSAEGGPAACALLACALGQACGASGGSGAEPGATRSAASGSGTRAGKGADGGGSMKAPGARNDAGGGAPAPPGALPASRLLAAATCCCSAASSASGDALCCGTPKPPSMPGKGKGSAPAAAPGQGTPSAVAAAATACCTPPAACAPAASWLLELSSIAGERDLLLLAGECPEEDAVAGSDEGGAAGVEAWLAVVAACGLAGGAPAAACCCGGCCAPAAVREGRADAMCVEVLGALKPAKEGGRSVKLGGSSLEAALDPPTAAAMLEEAGWWPRRPWRACCADAS